MKRITYIAIIAVWVIILGFVIIQWVRSPSKDQFEGIMGYADVLKHYNDARPIDINKPDDIGNNTEFARISAGLFANLQKIEIPLGDKYNAILAAKDPSSLLNAEASTRNRAVIASFVTEATEVERQRETLYEKYFVDVRALPIKNMVFKIEPMIHSIKEGKKLRETYTNDIITVATYIAYIIDFVNSRRGGNYFASNGQKLTFVSPEDQKYYDALVLQVETSKRNADKYRANLKSSIDASVNSLSTARKGK